MNKLLKRLNHYTLAALLVLALIAQGTHAYAQNVPIPNAQIQFLDNSGNPLALGQLFSYEAGTLTPKDTYQTASGTANTNPVSLNSAGRANVWLGSGSYKLILKNALGSTIWTVDNVPGSGTAGTDLTVSGNATIGGTLGVTGATTLSSTLAVVGNLAVNTNKFTVDAATGNIVVAGTAGVTGDFAVNTNKFTVAASSGNTAVAGTMGVTGAQTVGGALTVTGTITGPGSGITALNADNIASGTVPTARLGSGTANSSTFLRGDQTYATPSTGFTSCAVTSSLTGTATCASGTRTGGGLQCTGGGAVLDSYPSSTASWVGLCNPNVGTDTTYVICCQ
jgi:hypothetical protein